MKGTRKLPSIGINVPSWAQEFMTAVKQMLTPPAFPEGDKILVYNASTRLTDWVSLGSSITISDGTNGTVDVPVVINPPPFNDAEDDYPVGAVAFTTGINPQVLYGVGIWSAITGTINAETYQRNTEPGINFSGVVSAGSTITIKGGIITDIS